MTNFSLVSCQDMEIQTLFLFWDSCRRNISKQNKKKNLYSVFVDLKKAIDWVPNDTTCFMETRYRNKTS